MSELFYYADGDQAEEILRTGFVRTGNDGMIWAYDMDWPTQAALGPTTAVTNWSQTPVRFRLLDPEVMIPWKDLRLVLHPNRVWQLELAEGTMPDRWYGSSYMSLPVEPAPY